MERVGYRNANQIPRDEEKFSWRGWDIGNQIPRDEEIFSWSRLDLANLW